MAGKEKMDVVEGETDESFEVEKIVGKLVINGIVQYKIRWKGYGPEDDTWEPIENMHSCQDLLHIYEERQKQKEDEKRRSQDNSSSKCEKEKLNKKNKDESTVKKLIMQLRSKRKIKSSTSCKLSRMTSEIPMSDFVRKKTQQLLTTGLTDGNTNPLEAIKEFSFSPSGDQQSNEEKLSVKSTDVKPAKESNQGINKNDSFSNDAVHRKRKKSSLPSLADLLRRPDDSVVIDISSMDSDKLPVCNIESDNSLTFPESGQSSINVEQCDFLTKLNSDCKCFDIQNNDGSNDVIYLGTSVSSKEKTSFAAFDNTKEITASVDTETMDEPIVEVSKEFSVTSSAATDFDTKTVFSTDTTVTKADRVCASAPSTTPSKIMVTATENDKHVQDGHNRTCDSELKEIRNPCSFKTKEHKSPTGPVRHEAVPLFDIELDDLEWAKLEEEFKLEALTDEDLKKAVWEGNLYLVSRALSSNERYDLECPYLTGKTLLMTAVEKGFENVAACLLENGAMVDAQMKDGTTALMIAAKKGFSSIVDILTKYGAKINHQNVQGETALMKATQHGHDELVKTLLLYGANFSAENKDGLTALLCAQMSVHSETENVLVRHITRLTLEYEKQLTIILNNTVRIVSTLFPLQCLNLCERTEFIIKFNHKCEPLTPGVGYLMFIAHAMFLNNEVQCRFFGPCAVMSVYLNEEKQTSLTQDGNFVFSFNPVVDGNNHLVIKTMKASQAKTKLLVCAFKCQLLE